MEISFFDRNWSWRSNAEADRGIPIPPRRFAMRAIVGSPLSGGYATNG
jgi:hypothetical protein